MSGAVEFFALLEGYNVIYLPELLEARAGGRS